MQQQKISGSGVMVFINYQDHDYLLLLAEKRSGGLSFIEPGGYVSKRLSPKESALKELFEECFAGLSAKELNEERAILIERYLCYPLYISIEDLPQFKENLNKNGEIIRNSKSSRLHCYRESKFCEIFGLKEILLKLDKGSQLQLNNFHERARQSLKGFIQNKVIVDGQVKIPLKHCSKEKLNHPDEKDLLNILHQTIYVCSELIIKYFKVFMKLTKEFFMNLNALESFLNTAKNHSLTCIDKLISMYSKCVEHYDQLQDPIKYYFIDKIQSTLSSEYAIKAVIKQKQEDVKLEINLQQIEGISPSFRSKQVMHKLNLAQQDKSIDESAQLVSLVENYSNSARQNDQFIKKELNGQTVQFKERLKRRQQSLRHSMSHTCSVDILIFNK